MITIPSTTLAAALKAAASIVEARNTIPILTMVRLAASGDALEITTTNLDIEYRQTLPCTVTAPFQCAVDAKRLAAMASAATGDMTLTPGEKGVIAIKAGRSRWSAPTLPVDDFPVMPVDKLSPPLKMSGEDLAEIIRRTVWATSSDPARSYLGGIFLNDDGGKARYVATNGYALASILTASKWPKGAPNVIVPSDLANTLLGAAGEGHVTLEWDAGKLRFTAGNLTVTGKMIEGQFPDYNRIYPSPSEPMAVEAEELLGAVRRVRIASDAQTRRLRLKREDGVLAVRIEGTSGFEGSEDVVAECSAGFESGVNADYLEGMLKAAESETVSIEQDEPMGTFLVRPISGDLNMSFSGLIWPLRV